MRSSKKQDHKQHNTSIERREIFILHSPCSRECLKRSAECRLTCQAWIEYETEHAKELDSSYERKKAEGMYIGYIARQSKRRKD